MAFISRSRLDEIISKSKNKYLNERTFDELVNSKDISPYESQITLDVVRTF